MKTTRFFWTTLIMAVSTRGLATPSSREAVVRQYFQGVNDQNPALIRECFATSAVIQDVCGLNTSRRTAEAEQLVERCMEFLAAHPDTVVDFHYGPECGRSSNWVVAHWYETGTWSGKSCGLEPRHEPMAVEGQTRFLVNEDDKITELVVTRTFTDWEKQMLLQRQAESTAQA